MTEAEWAVCQDPEKMLEYLLGRASDRKLRLFAVACVRRHDSLMALKPMRLAVQLAERYAEGRLSGLRLARRGSRVRLADKAADAVAVGLLWPGPDYRSALDTSRACVELLSPASGEQQAQVALVRDLFGNPWHAIAIASAVLAWQHGTVGKMATTIYEERKWEDMPLLGDALEEAGVTDQAVLDHCRGSGPHARGCHLVDAILGKG